MMIWLVLVIRTFSLLVRSRIEGNGFDIILRALVSVSAIGAI